VFGVFLTLELTEIFLFPRGTDVSAETLTTMELKRLDLARALAAHPKVLLLDELGAGLRPAEVDQLITLIRQLRDEGVTLVVVEHVMRLIAGVCDRVVVLHYGEKIADGPTSEVGRDPRVAEAYLGSEAGIA
jgi:branched-chain amino acid transport system ATP-binding protein